MQEYQEDFYAFLGVEESATADEIRKAYLKLAKKLHPDRFPNDPEKRAEAQQEFSRVTRAHEVLSDPKRKEEYDAIRTLTKARSGEHVSAEASTEAAAGKSDVKAEGKETWAAKHNERANDLVKRKRYPEAETAIKEAIRLCPNNATYHAVLAEIHLARGWRTLATTSVQAALKIDPKNHEAKQLELKLKASSKTSQGKDSKKDEKMSQSGTEKKGLLDQLKDLLNKKM